MILGEDWLEQCSPMWVHWTKKIMRFVHNGSSITLRGVKPEVTKCSAISVGKLKGLIRRKAITHCVQLLPSTTQSQSIDSTYQQVSSVQIPKEIQSAMPDDMKALLS
jgi:hypothetical protein